jgi:putative hemolysin
MNNNNTTPVKIDIEKVIKDKNPKLAKILPRFIINYIKKTLHQDELNYVLEKYKDKFGLEFVHAVLNEFNVKYKVNGEHNIPKEGRYIFAANHPLGGIESVAMMRMIGQYHKNIRFIVNDVLLNLKNYDPLFVPVNKFGAQARESAKILENVYASDNQVLIFPAGLVSRKINGKVQDLEWQKSFITKARQYKRDIVPVFIHGENSKFFYRLASIRRLLGIKANIEMFYLADEMFKKTNSTIEYNIGKPISWQTFDKRHTPKEWAALIRNHVYKIKENVDIDFKAL